MHVFFTKISSLPVAKLFWWILNIFYSTNAYSAYSIFNEDFRELPGTLNADRLDRDIRAGQFWALLHFFQSFQHWCQVTWCVYLHNHKEITTTVPMKMTSFLFRAMPLLCIYHCTMYWYDCEEHVSLWITVSMSLISRFLFMSFRVLTLSVQRRALGHICRDLSVRNQNLTCLNTVKIIDCNFLLIYNSF